MFYFTITCFVNGRHLMIETAGTCSTFGRGARGVHGIGSSGEDVVENVKKGPTESGIRGEWETGCSSAKFCAFSPFPYVYGVSSIPKSCFFSSYLLISGQARVSVPTWNCFDGTLNIIYSPALHRV